MAKEYTLHARVDIPFVIERDTETGDIRGQSAWPHHYQEARRRIDRGEPLYLSEWSFSAIPQDVAMRVFNTYPILATEDDTSQRLRDDHPKAQKGQ